MSAQVAADRLKRAAAERAVGFIESGMLLGLGTGSTARHVVEVLAARLSQGELRDVTGVPTSVATAEHAASLGIRLASLEDAPRLDLTIDGADEVDRALDLIKGLGGALLWEKIVASVSSRLVIVVDESKHVSKLGERVPVPIEVTPFGWNTHLDFFKSRGGHAELRRREDGSPFITDGGHYIIDCRFEDGVPEPARFEHACMHRVGVVETGLFLGMATEVVTARAGGVDVLTREVRA